MTFGSSLFTVSENDRSAFIFIKHSFCLGNQAENCDRVYIAFVAFCLLGPKFEIVRDNFHVIPFSSVDVAEKIFFPKLSSLNFNKNSENILRAFKLPISSMLGIRG